jgi:hypothetical protein
MGTVVFRLEGDDAGAVQAFLRLTDAQKKAELQAMRTGAAGARATQKMKRGARSAESGMSSLTSSLKGFVSGAAAIAMATRALTAFNEEKRKAAEGIETGEFARAQLAQLADTPEQMRKLVAESNKSRAQEGMTQIAADQLQFQLTSLGLAQHRGMFASMYGMADVAQLAEGVGTLQQAFGKQETGDARRVVNKLLTASQTSKTTIEQFSPAATLAAKQMGMIGGTDEELYATLSVLAKSLKSADMAGTQIGGLADVLTKKGFTGKGLLGGVTEMEKYIKAQGIEGEEFIKFFGRKEARLAYLSVLKDRDQIKETQKAIEAADVEAAGQDAITRKLAARAGDETIMASRRKRIAAQQKELALEPGGVQELTEEAQITAWGAKQRREGVNWLDYYLMQGEALAAKNAPPIGALGGGVTETLRRQRGTSGRMNLLADLLHMIDMGPKNIVNEQRIEREREQMETAFRESHERKTAGAGAVNVTVNGDLITEKIPAVVEDSPSAPALQ